MGPRLSSSLVGRSSSVNDRDCPLVSVCVVSRWLGQRFWFFCASGGGGAQTHPARGQMPVAFVLWQSQVMGPRRSLVREASSRKALLWNSERWDQHYPAHLPHSHIPQPGIHLEFSIIVLDY